MTGPTAGAAPRLETRALDDTNRAAVIRFLRGTEDRPAGEAFERWRFADCPVMEALVCMAGDECVGTMFSMRRDWGTADGPKEFVEPFEWHSSEAWRAQAPGLRIVRQRMREPAPMIAVAGTDVAADLLRKLKWHEVATASKFALPLSGAYLRVRGRSANVARVFDVVGTPLFRPRRRRQGTLAIETATTYAPEVRALAERQRRFALMRLPDARAEHWMRRAPAVVGNYIAFHARRDDRIVGWGLGRVFSQYGIRVGELLEVFMTDEARGDYLPMMREMSVVLAGHGVDALLATSTCEDTIRALGALKFRPDDLRPVLGWFGGAAPPNGPILIDGAISDHAFYPLPTAAAGAWLTR